MSDADGMETSETDRIALKQWADDNILGSRGIANRLLRDFARLVSEREKVRGEAIECSVATMQTSAGPDYYVLLRRGDRDITPHVFKIKGRAEYEVAEWKWFFGGEKPDILAFDTETDLSPSTLREPSAPVTGGPVNGDDQR